MNRAVDADKIDLVNEAFDNSLRRFRMATFHLACHSLLYQIGTMLGSGPINFDEMVEVIFGEC